MSMFMLLPSFIMVGLMAACLLHLYTKTTIEVLLQDMVLAILVAVISGELVYYITIPPENASVASVFASSTMTFAFFHLRYWVTHRTSK